MPPFSVKPIKIKFPHENISDNWTKVFNALNGTYVILDLSNCYTNDNKTITGDSVEKTTSELKHINEFVKGMILPSDLKAIGAYAFAGCKTLISMIIPSGVKTIGEGAFDGSRITSITIPSGFEIIESITFRTCTNLTSIIIPSDVTRIGNTAFSHCNSLISVTLPSDIEEFGNYAFPGIRVNGHDAGTDALKTLYEAPEGGAGTYTRTAGEDNWAKQ